MRWPIALTALLACTPIAPVSTRTEPDAALPREHDDAPPPRFRQDPPINIVTAPAAEGGGENAAGNAAGGATGRGEAGSSGAAGAAGSGGAGAGGSKAAAGAGSAPPPPSSDEPMPVSCTPNAVLEGVRGSLRLACDGMLDLDGRKVAYLALPPGANAATAQRFTELAISALLKKLKFTTTVRPSGISNAAGCDVDDCRTISEFRLQR